MRAFKQKQRKRNKLKGDHALAAASDVFDDCVHLLCQWHLTQDFKKNLLAHVKDVSMRDTAVERFSALFHVSQNPVFEEKIKELLSPFPAGHGFRSYFEKNLLSKKEKWGGPWVAELPLYGIRSTQLVEIINRNAKRFADHKTSIPELVSIIDQLVTSVVSPISFFPSFLLSFF